MVESEWWHAQGQGKGRNSAVGRQAGRQARVREQKLRSARQTVAGRIVAQAGRNRRQALRSVRHNARISSTGGVVRHARVRNNSNYGGCNKHASGRRAGGTLR